MAIPITRRCLPARRYRERSDKTRARGGGALIRWYLDGADVQSNLPKLALYMGHVSIVSTAYYLHFVPRLRAIASDRFEREFGDLVGEVAA